MCLGYVTNKEKMKLSNHIFQVECSSYDFKQEVERKKTKNWLKSISAFANGTGGSLFFGVDNDAQIVGLKNPQNDAEFISRTIKDHLDPVPNFSLIPHHEGEATILEVNVKSGTQTPYYYYLDGTRTAFIRIGNESVVAEQQQLMGLVLKGTHSTYDAMPTGIPRSKHSFVMLANTFEERTHKPFEEKMLESMGLVNSDAILTQAGLLFADNCPVYQSKLVCTRWTGLYKDNAINDQEYKGNLIMLLRFGMEFVKSVTNRAWVKLPNRRKNLPDYEERAVLETLVNHLIHRDYTFIGAEVHMDIYDDRMVFNSPGGMYDGTLIQNRDIYNVPSVRRNPVLADVFTQLDYMEKRGSGLKKICELTAQLNGYTEQDKPEFLSEANFFYTTLRNVNYGVHGTENGDTEINTNKVHRQSSQTKFTESSQTNGNEKPTRNKLVEIIIRNKNVTTEQMANLLNISRRAVAKHIKKLQEEGIIRRIGPDFGGHWEIVKKEKEV